MIRVAVVDDHPVTRRGLIAILSGVADIGVVAGVADIVAVVDAGRTVDVLIVDPYPFAEPPRLATVRASADRTAVVAWSASHDRGDVFAALKAGARGYVTKDSQDDVYLAAVRCVGAGGVFLSSTAARSRASTVAGPAAQRAMLSEREREALAYVGGGFTHQQTATRMGVSKATVDTYIGRIRTKLQVGNKAELALAALRYVDHPAVRL